MFCLELHVPSFDDETKNVQIKLLTALLYNQNMELDVLSAKAERGLPPVSERERERERFTDL